MDRTHKQPGTIRYKIKAEEHPHASSASHVMLSPLAPFCLSFFPLHEWQELKADPTKKNCKKYLKVLIYLR